MLHLFTKCNFFRLQIWLDQLWPARQNFMGAICHVTPVLNVDLCRFDLMYLTPLPKFHRCILSCYACVKWYFRSMQIQLDVFDPPAKILWMHFVTLHHSHSTNQHPATPDTTKTTCYRSAAQCWKAFLVEVKTVDFLCFLDLILNTVQCNPNKSFIW